MILIVIIASVLAAALQACSSVMEREAAGTPEVSELFTKNLSLTIAKNQKFLFGVGLQLLASAMEVIALIKGSLIVVTPILTLDLVFLLIFLSIRYHLKVRLENWLAVSGIVIGLSLLYLFTQPHDHHVKYAFWPWSIALGIVSLIIVAAIIIVPKLKSIKLRAGLMALATASSYGLNAGLLKLVLTQFRYGGLHSVVLNWTLYVLIFFAVVSVYLMQNTFSAGPIVISQPVIEIVQPLVSVAIGLFIFDDVINDSSVGLIGDTFSVAIIVFSIIVLARSDSLFIDRHSSSTKKVHI
jgi:hypothetical protein